MRKPSSPGAVAVFVCAALLALAALATPRPAAAQSLIRDSEIEATLRAYAEPLLTAAELNPGDVRINVLQDPTLNAFVTGGQNIFFHTGLIQTAETPLQLKGVMAHEIGHIAGGHLARSREAIEGAYAPAIVSIGLGILAIAAGAPDAGAALIAGSQQLAVASFFRHTKVQESSADQAAMTFLEDSGQSGAGLLEFFEEFRYQEVVSEQRRNPYFRSHPLSSDRIESLRLRVSGSPHRETPDSAEDVERFVRMQAKLFGFLEPPTRTFTRYPETDTSIPARYARAVAAYRVPDIARATAETEALIAEEPENPYFQELLGQILFEAGRSAASVPPYRRAVALKPGDALIETGLARAILAAEGKAGAEEAAQILERVVTREPDNPFAWRELAGAYDKLGKPGLAQLATAEQAFSQGDYPRALNFAERAKRALDAESIAWRRAADISLVVRNAMAERRRGG